MLGLAELRGRLVLRLRDMVRNGELTERALARTTVCRNRTFTMF